MGERPEVLSIDDDQVFAENLKVYFSRRGIPVATITDSSVAVAVDFSKFKIILLDLEMPNISGFEIVRQLPEERRPLVVVISGHSGIDTRITVLDRGADFFISKPVDFAELFIIVKRALDRETKLSDDEPEWVLRRSQQSLSSPNGTSYGLSGSEFRILEKLMQCAPDAVSKEDLSRAANGRLGSYGANYIRSLEVMISRMRSRFSSEEAPLPVKSMRNVGYFFYGRSTVVD